MRKVFYNSGSSSGSCVQGEGSVVKTDSGWEVEDTFACRKEIYKINEDLIHVANVKISLSDIFKSYKVYFDDIYSPSGWTQRRSCPFPDHNDVTPSFHYNVAENRFYCFGCKRGGQAVHFVSIMEEMPLIVAAEKIIDKFESLEGVVLDYQNKKNDELDNILLKFSEQIQKFIYSNNTQEAREFIESITWGLDIYLHKHVPRSSLDVDNLTARIRFLNRKLDEYGK